MSPGTRTRHPNLPKYVSESNGRIVYRPYIKASERQHIQTDKYGFLKPPVRLGRLDDPEDEILQSYLKARRAIENLSGDKRNTLRWVVDQYTASMKFKSLAPGSQKQADFLRRILEHPVSVDKKPSTLGDLRTFQITKPMVRRLADKRLQDYQGKGKKGLVTVNREISFLSTAMSWALQNIDDLGIRDNPFKISKFKEIPNERYVTDEEYDQQSKLAKQIAPYLPIVFEITYLLASRGVETLDIKLSDIDPDREKGGIFVRRRKGSKDNFIEWSDRLYKAYLEARNQHSRFTVSKIDAPLILGNRGKQLTREGFNTAMQRLKKLMENRGLEDQYWSLHLLKHKGVTDAKDNRIAGHVSEQMRNRYDHRVERIKPAK